MAKKEIIDKEIHKNKEDKPKSYEFKKKKGVERWNKEWKD